ncbi:MAG: hypothetical protein AVDCRST_MAG49-1492 [uncultured Thermomicrobiales bacterium]|uniref:Uncharacterized protein n=1 Tax=uncultured Thermomicrobiales bacterium TaxID=1645740 RepID=A0A6J4UF95_9BACT|nr:MAG: hypothetical protein AVDCRST_MAG49-1492 [uncultured Thermomicrobiales bacterium]
MWRWPPDEGLPALEGLPRSAPRPTTGTAHVSSRFGGDYGAKGGGVADGPVPEPGRRTSRW